MTILEWLRKLGILRFGAEAAIYRNAADRPLSLQAPAVFDSERDVWNMSPKAEPTPPREPQPPGDRQ